MSTRIFLALARRVERVHAERRAAWVAADDAANDRLMRRLTGLQNALFNILLP